MKRREFLSVSTILAAGVSLPPRFTHAASPQGRLADDASLILGQGDFRYRLNRFWGLLNRAETPVDDCHAITENREGQIVLLTNHAANNLIVYTKHGAFVSKRENRFPRAHALEFETDAAGDERLWITDHGISVVSLCACDGRELRRLTPDHLAAKYPDLSRYHPTNVAVMPDGDFFVSDGYGSHYIHHFDPDWKLVASFGGAGTAPENLRQPHAVWLDRRRGKPELLICDRGNELLKWFSAAGELLRIVPVPGARPCNVTQFAGDHLAIPALNGMVLILDGSNRIVSVIGGEPARYEDGRLQPLVAFNYAFIHPHDVHADAAGHLYVAQWDSNRSYPLKLERVAGTT